MDAQYLCLVADALKQQPVRKLVQPTVEGFVPFLALLELKVLQSQDSVRARPSDEAFSDCLAVGLGKVALAERQPFQQSTDTPCVLMLCLTLRQLSLQPCHFLTMLLPPNPQLQPAFKKDFTCPLHGDQQIRLVAVSANQDRTFNSGFRERHAQIANQLPVAFLDDQAVKEEVVKEVTEKVVRDRKKPSVFARQPSRDLSCRPF
jgi:hypothetical protein